MRKTITTFAVVLMLVGATSCEKNSYTSGRVYSTEIGSRGECDCMVSLELQDGTHKSVYVACPCDIQPGDSCRFVFGNSPKDFIQ